MKTKNNVDKKSPEYLTRAMSNGRNNLLLILIFTLINLALMLLDSNTYFLFSASVPYYLTAFCIGLDGMTVGFFTAIALVISAVILGIYLLCWLFSKKKMGWFVVAMVMFVLDTVCLVIVAGLLGMFADCILDFVFHIWATVSMIQGIRANSRWKALVAAEQQQMAYQPPYNGPEF